MNHPDFVVVIPCYNEAETLPDLISQCKKHADKVIVVDDGSSDDSSEMANSSGAIVLRNKLNLGVARAVKKGIEYAVSLNPKFIVQLDGDGQHNPDEIPLLIEPLVSEDCDLVVGSRFMDGGTHIGITSIRYFGNKLFSKLISKMCYTRLTDAQSGFRAYTLEVASKIEIESTFSYTQEYLVRAARKGYKIVEVPIKVRERTHGKSKVVNNIPGFTIKQLITLIRIWRDFDPIKAFGSIGVSMALFGATLGLIAFVQPKHQVLIGTLGTISICMGIGTILFGFFADMFRKQ